MAYSGIDKRHVSDRFKQSAVVEPFGPFQRGKLDGLKPEPGSASADHVGFVETVDALRPGVVIAVADAADGGFDARSARRSV